MFLTFLSYVMMYVPLRDFLRILEYMGHFSEFVLNGKKFYVSKSKRKKTL